MEIFGWSIERADKEPDLKSFTPKQEDDGAVEVASGPGGAAGTYGTYIDMDGAVRTESELVNKYREVSDYPEVELAIDDIVNEAIVSDPMKDIVTINLDGLKQNDNIKNMIKTEFDTVLKLLEFDRHCYEIFRKWYVDGRIYYHLLIDEKQPQLGIQECRYIDPRKIRKIRAVKKERIKNTQMNVAKTTDEFFIYNERGFSKLQGSNVNPTSYEVGSNGIKVAKDSVIHVTSGMINAGGDLILGYLQKAVKPLNMLKSMEDSLLIYRISRAPERRIFYVDVGNLPKAKAEQYVNDLMTKFKNKVVYDSASGEIRNDRRFMTMLEDFWLPRREGGRGTEISTLPGGQNLSEIDDILYFQRKLYKALNVPISRLDPETQYNFGRATEISRDEVKFAKFVQRIRLRFCDLFTKTLEKQLILKGIITQEDAEEFRDHFKYDFSEDNHFAELRNTEILRDRITMLRDAEDFVGSYFSHNWVRRHILYQTDDDMATIDKEIEKEKAESNYQDMVPINPDQQSADGQAQ